MQGVGDGPEQERVLLPRLRACEQRDLRQWPAEYFAAVGNDMSTRQLEPTVGEGLHPCPRESNRADHNPFAQQRHAEDGPELPKRNRLG